MVATTVHLLRHGEVHNPTGVLYGRLDGFRLSERGRAMAEMVAAHLAGESGGERRDITVVTASPLQRAQETAGPIAAAFDLPIGVDENLLEAINQFEGLTFGVGDGSLRHPRHWPLLRNPFRPSWGEPYRVQVDRMLAAVDTAREAARGHEALLVSHQLPIWVTRRALENRRLWHDPRRRECSVASLTSLRFEDDRLVGIDYSEPAGALLPGVAGVPGA
ncbi:histidine phosphatase family protein [Cellulomonas chengniuliangii]|uniref:Histidine phosphatase family protein n=1 Tax=Cellulomonas chengniuliangii TaxID=2968084 RepID=A0ABY5KXM0_9CELL|nr:histidine phosphatase family protein [Cellulomonas chengniuliangii]MCC2309535.1 histidine phosphatase family protein [Cellulomonas chengniuliangii]MCC2316806.1 histidine phosphatase family protein [Cellulomonas chengniuliangii]UUI74909.1 histidine phosphatase family protein [Cellulomonas chengniuliangii]